MRKKILSLALALAMCLGLMIVPAAAADSDFTIKDGVLTKYNGSGGSVVIPNSVVEIGDNAFYWCENLTSVVIPGSVFVIGDCAFSSCYNLTSVTISNGVEFIDFAAFAYCTSLTSVVIPSSVVEIGWSVFQECHSLTSVVIPSSVTEIGDAAFWNCYNLTDVYYGGSKAQWNALSIDDANDYLFYATIHYNSTGPSTIQPQQPQQPAAETTASPTNDKLEVNGNAADPTVYKIGGGNYFKIRDVAALLNGTEKQFSVGYDGEKNAVTATTGEGYDKQSGDLAGAAKGGDQTAAASNDAIYVNGEKITAEVYKINGSNYFKLRDLGKALDFYVGWSADRGMYIETDKPYSE